MNELNRRAGPHKAWFECSMDPTGTETIVVKHETGQYWRQDLDRGLGEHVLEQLGFVRGPEFWFRRVTARPG